MKESYRDKPLLQTGIKYRLVEILGYIIIISFAIFMFLASIYLGLIVLVIFISISSRNPMNVKFYEDEMIFVYVFK